MRPCVIRLHLQPLARGFSHFYVCFRLFFFLFSEQFVVSEDDEIEAHLNYNWIR